MKYTILFPGQGSQSVGMGQFLYKEFKEARVIFEEASDVLGLDIKKLCFTGSEEDLALTENTQPALLTTSIATFEVLKNILGIQTQLTAGHSIGEYASLVITNVIPFSLACKAVKFRGQAMQSAVPVGIGGMTATLGLNEEQALFLCNYAVQQSGAGPLSPANYNCDGQIVISGNLKSLNWLKDNYSNEIFIKNNLPEPRRAKLIPLQVSAPFHCDMMKPAEENMAQFFGNIHFNNATVPIVQNVHAQLESVGAKIKENIIKQVSAPVRWTQTMTVLKNEGQSNIIECGNGSVLKGLLKKHDAEFFKVFSVNNLDDLKLIETAQKSV